MQLPNRQTPVARCEALGMYTERALRSYGTRFAPGDEKVARLNALADTVVSATGALVTAQDAYRRAVLAVVGARVDLKLVDLEADDLVRSVKRAADEAGKPIAQAVFKDGITPIVRAFGSTQAKALRDLEGRIAAATKWEGRAAQAARIEAVRAAYEAALEARRAGTVAAADARAARDMVKEDFLDVFAAAAGAVREMFPRDRPRQDVFFDAVARRGAAGALEDDGEGDGAVEDEGV